MKVNYNAGTLEIDMHSILEDVSPVKKLEMLESLACDDAIIKHVADQIIHRWTENSCSGGSSGTIPADASRGTPLDDAWRRVAKASGDVANEEIERLERGLAQRDRQLAELRQEIREMVERRQSVLS